MLNEIRLRKDAGWLIAIPTALIAGAYAILKFTNYLWVNIKAFYFGFDVNLIDHIELVNIYNSIVIIIIIIIATLIMEGIFGKAMDKIPFKIKNPIRALILAFTAIIVIIILALLFHNYLRLVQENNYYTINENEVIVHTGNDYYITAFYEIKNDNTLVIKKGKYKRINSDNIIIEKNKYKEVIIE